MNGFDYFGAELLAFSEEIHRIEQDIDLIVSRLGQPNVNATHEAFRYRVRANFVAVSLVSLVEYRLYDIARRLCSNFNSKKAADLPGLRRCLENPKDHATKAPLPRGRDVTQLTGWENYELLCLIRHPIVHGFGDITLGKRETEARNAIKTLKLGEILAADPRIAFTVPALTIALDVVRKVMSEIEVQDKATT
jgi:hypothetical protein